MKYDAAEQAFRKLRARIYQRFGHYYRDDLRRIKNKPLLEAFLLRAALLNREEIRGNEVKQ